jgi:hypothetical protein
MGTVAQFDRTRISYAAHMEALTEKPDWHVKVFNSEIVAKWREEAPAMPLIGVKAWDWCLAELQDKAALFERTGRVLVFNTGSAISKSDTLVTPELQAELRQGLHRCLLCRMERRTGIPIRSSRC